MHCRRLAVTWARILQQICGQEICEGRNAHGHLTRATLCENLHYSKDAVQQQGDNHFVRACEVETLNQISQELFYERIYRINAAPQDLENTAPQTLPMDISQEQFRARICRKNAGAPESVP